MDDVMLIPAVSFIAAVIGSIIGSAIGILIIAHWAQPYMDDE